MECLNELTGKEFNINLHGVLYHPKQTSTLISMARVNKMGFHLVTKSGPYFESSGKNPKFRVRVDASQGLPFILVKCKPAAVVNATSAVYKLPPDYSIDIKYDVDRFADLQAKFGPFDYELFASELNHHLQNFSIDDPERSAWLFEWIGKHFYGNPPYINAIIYKMFAKAMADFQKDPFNTQFTFIVPNWPNAPWFKTFMQYFDIVERLEMGTEKVFTVPVREHGRLEKTDNDPGRAYLPPIHWDVLVVHKDRHTKSTVDDIMLAHLKLGHASIDKLRECQQVYGLPHPCKQIPADYKLYCNICSLCKAQRRLRFKKKRKLLPTEPSRNGGGTIELAPNAESDDELADLTETEVKNMLDYQEKGKWDLVTEAAKEPPSQDEWERIRHASEETAMFLNERTALMLKEEAANSVSVRNPDFHIKETERKLLATTPGKLVYVDFMYIRYPGVKKEEYALFFIDHATRFLYVYPTAGRKEAYKILERYIIEMRTQFTTIIHGVHGDMAGEFTSPEWSEVCTRYGIRQEHAASQLHESSGIVERVIQTIRQMLRCVMVTSSCTKKEWSLAILFCVWIYNRLPHSSIDQKNKLLDITSRKCPLEALTGLRPDYERIQIWGCPAYHFKEKSKRGDNQFGERAKRYVYVGNNERTNGYILYDRDANRIHASTGIVQFAQNVDELARLISDPEARLRDTIADQNTIAPKGLLEGQQAENITASEILDTEVLYDKHADICHALIQFEKDENLVWIRLVDLLKNKRNRKANAQVLSNYISTHQLTLVTKHGRMFMRVGLHNNNEEAIIIEQKGTKHGYSYGLCDVTDIGKANYGRCQTITAAKASRQIQFDAFTNHAHSIVDRGTTPDGPQCPCEHCVNQYAGNIFSALLADDTSNLALEMPSKGEDIERVNMSHEAERSGRPTVNKMNTKYLNYKEPKNLKEARTLEDAGLWEKAAQAELQQMHKQKVFVPVTQEEWNKTLKITGSRFVFKLKLDQEGNIEKYKARLVAQGYTQVHHVNYEESFSPTPQISGTRFVLSYILQNDLKCKGGDVTGAFLNAELKEEIYMKLPEGIEFEGARIVKLLKCLYGLKQAGREWYEHQHRIIMAIDPELKRCTTDPCIYYKKTEDCTFIISVHVDDYIMGYDNENYFNDFVAKYKEHVDFTVKDLDFILQMKLEWIGGDAKALELSQTRQIDALVDKFGRNLGNRIYKTPMLPSTPQELQNIDPKDVSKDIPYASLVCALLYIARCTRPDIMFAVNFLCRSLTKYTEEHYKAALRVLQYLRGTRTMKLRYVKDRGGQGAEIYSDVEMFCDASLDKKGPSTCGGIFRYHGNAITWFCQKQEDSSTSSAESEYKTFGIAFKQGMYFVNLLQDDMKIPITPILVHEDNKAAIEMVKQLMSNSRTAHIANPYHWVREHVRDKKNFRVQHLLLACCTDHWTPSAISSLHQGCDSL